MNILTPEQFKSNVEAWAEERGIYEHSTPFAQLMKATSEIGELCDAIIKGRTDDIKDAVGDVAVCLVNFAKMVEFDLLSTEYGLRYGGSWPVETVCLQEEIERLIVSLGALLGNQYVPNIQLIDCFMALREICLHLKIYFMECCTIAWNEIKDRKGKMVAGGAFVKEGDA